MLRLIGAGLSNAEIAIQLQVSESTVKTTSTTCSPRSKRGTGRRRSPTPSATASRSDPRSIRPRTSARSRTGPWHRCRPSRPGRS
ncbi:LuxR C-terminal-related transcriptional regulator [Actinoplanes sp. NPDC051343]|uniref:LuxR C-terminal-related transcriptional regulator n=1 Tax=Actinoplanes sp. NPDC051343 TaxID=3363906 RepID=UPI00379B660C